MIIGVVFYDRFLFVKLVVVKDKKVEECSEVKYDGFKELLGRLRHPTLKLHMILSTNPVSKGNWSYKHFFKDEAR